MLISATLADSPAPKTDHNKLMKLGLLPKLLSNYTKYPKASPLL